MQIDLENEAPGTTCTSQVCVLGAGIAGLILAHRLAAQGFTVDLLEAGGLDLEQRSQTLYAAQMARTRHTGTTDGRFRVFGGSSTRWGGQLLPFTGDIFQPAPAMPSSAWPIAPETLEPYYAGVLQIMGADALPFDGPDLLSALRHPSVPLGDAVRLRFSKWAPFGRRNLANTLGKDCLASEKVRVFLHANALRLNAAPANDRIESVSVKNYAGADFLFRADHFCVCLGTIESSRLLLCSGVGNAHDQVGRYFHDHVSLRAAEITGIARTRVLDRLGPFFVHGTLHTCKLEASAEVRARERLPAVMAHVVIEEPEDSGAAAVRNLLRSLQRGKLAEALGRNLVPMLRGLGDVVRLVWDSKIRQRRAVSSRALVWLHLDMEQIASPEDRIRLSDDTDVLGQPKAIVDWRIGEPERETARRFGPIVQAALEDAGIAGLRWLDGPAGQPMADTYHPMGGLRMGLSTADSVVAPDLGVHGVANLHIASCAVFPAGGSSNPTFTMMALTLRLVDRLTRLLKP